MRRKKNKILYRLVYSILKSFVATCITLKVLAIKS